MTRDHYYFLRIPECSFECVQTHSEQLQSVGMVVKASLGTGRDTLDGWFVVKSWAASINTLRVELEKIGLTERVEHVEQLKHPDEGQTLAKQTSLF